MKRSPMPPRKKRLKSSRTPMRQRRQDPKRRRFAALRNDAFREWIRGQRCALRGCVYRSEIQCAHVKTRGAGGVDVGNCLPLCRWHHHHQHAVGIKSFAKFHGIDMRALATKYAEAWLAAHPEVT